MAGLTLDRVSSASFRKNNRGLQRPALLSNPVIRSFIASFDVAHTKSAKAVLSTLSPTLLFITPTLNITGP